MSAPVAAFCMDGVGHLHCLLPVVEGLVGRGHDVSVFTRAGFAPKVEATGARFVDLYADGTLEEVDPESVPIPSRYVTFAADRADVLTRRVAGLGAGLVLYDTFSVVAHVIARRLGVAGVNVVANHAPVRERALAQLATDPRVDISDRCRAAAAELHRTGDVADATPFSYVDHVSTDLNVYPEPEEFLVPADRAAFDPVAYFGCLGGGDVERVDWPGAVPDAACRVYVSFGTVIWWYFAETAARALVVLADAFAGRDVDVVVSLGGHPLPADQRALLARPNVAVVDHVDQRAVLANADVFVTHHGVNSTHESVFAEVPMLSYPFFGDQPALARRCGELGLAVPLVDVPRSDLEVAAVHDGLDRLAMGRPRFAERLAEAREWELRTIAGRPGVLDRLCALVGR